MNSYTAKSNSIATSYNDAMNSYTSTSNSINNSYNDAMNSYTSASNSISTSYQNAMNSYNTASIAISQANQAAQISYAQAQLSYQQALSAWQSAHNESVNRDGLDTTTVTQTFNLASDEQATLNVESLNPNVKVVHFSGGGWDPNTNSSLVYTAGDAHLVPINGPLARATWTNLHGSYYGNTPISKMVITFSDSTPTGNKVHPAGISESGFLNIFKNPTYQLYHSTDITAQYEFYDKDGNRINFANNNAWLSVGSLNTDLSNQAGLVGEAVKLISGGQSYAIRGSSITKHSDGWLYSNYDNYNGTGMNHGQNWDSNDSPNAYYGACVFKMEGPSITLRYGLKETTPGWIEKYDQTPDLNQAWATAVTTIPVTPGPKYPDPPKYKPEPIKPQNPSSVTPPTPGSINKPNLEPITPPSKEPVPEHHHAEVSYHSNTLIQWTTKK